MEVLFIKSPDKVSWSFAFQKFRVEVSRQGSRNSKFKRYKFQTKTKSTMTLDEGQTISHARFLLADAGKCLIFIGWQLTLSRFQWLICQLDVDYRIGLLLFYLQFMFCLVSVKCFLGFNIVSSSFNSVNKVVTTINFWSFWCVYYDFIFVAYLLPQKVTMPTKAINYKKKHKFSTTNTISVAQSLNINHKKISIK